ncbi:MAG TPA: hypothetical protein DCZ92_14395 [Elusimicrobia bacterium]|nr:MAG: hypothetical protein A2016_08985 [Elusimicrobia bacterium GWF2_62_30]HBA61973.1 hypothetical protein [Elusimicrobiota bacterium]
MRQKRPAARRKIELNQIINVTAACNQRCLFCSRDSWLPPHPPKLIRASIRKFKDSVCFEGGEPTLFPDTLKWIRFAKKEGVRNVVLVTNGFSLDDPAAAEKYVEAGVDFFNVNLPAHTPALYDALTRTRANFARRVKAVRTLIRAAGGRKVRVTLVATSVMIPKLPEYALFVLRNFPELLYLEINFPKLLGGCVERPWLIPDLAACRLPLRTAVKLLQAGGMKVITDGFPLCAMKGFEYCAIDAHAAAYGDLGQDYLAEKEQRPPCSGCSLAAVCRGPRKDYVSRHGWKELRPSRVTPASVKAKIEKVFGRRGGGSR